MRLRKAIKKIVALGTGSTMIGATLLAASAANLADYPSPFVKDGVFNAKLVVGAQAAAQDVIGSIEIATGLQTKSVTTSQVSTGGTSATTQLIGDSFKMEKSSDKLNMYERLNDPVEVVTSAELDALAGGSITNEKGTYKYDQFIVLKESGVTGVNSTSASVVYDTDSDQSDDPALYLKFDDNYRVYTYRLSFPTALKSDVDASDDLDDLDNKKLTMLGKEYTIINTDNSTGMLELMGGALQDTIQEYEKKTYNLNGKDYEVEVVAISSTNGGEVIMKVNGEVSEKKVEGETIKLSDGTEIGIKTILENEGTETGGGDLVTFYLGASKVTLTDGKLASGNTDGTLKVGDDTIEDVTVDLVGSSSSGETSISKIEIIWIADEDYYVPVGEKLSEGLSGVNKNKLLLKNLDFEFAAVQQGTTREIKFVNSGSDKYKVTFPTKTGGTLSEEMFYVSSELAGDGNISLGKSSSYKLIINPAVVMTKNDRFLVSSNKYSHLIQVGSFSTTDSKITMKDLGTGESFDVSVTAGAGTMYLDGYAYSFTANVAAEQVTMTTFGTDGNGVAYTPEKFKLTFSTTITGNESEGYFQGKVLITEDEQESGDGGLVDTVTVTMDDAGSSDKMTIENVVSSDVNFTTQSWDSKDDWTTAYTRYGTLVEWDTSGTQDAVTLSIGSQANVEVFMTSGVTQVSSSGGATEGTVTTTTVNEIQVGSAVLDTEITDVTADNYIVVGGPCANSAAARLVGVAQKIPECLSGLSLSEGEGVVKLFENGGKVSMLVAGATALDSQRASRVVAQYDKYPEFTGMEVSVTGTSLSDITVSAPTQVE